MFARFTDRLPLQFRVLYRQFLLRVVDLEALSMEADVPKLLGQFAGVLILISVFQTIGFLYAAGLPHVTPEAVTTRRDGAGSVCQWGRGRSCWAHWRRVCSGSIGGERKRRCCITRRRSRR